MEIIQWGVILLISLAVLIKSADIFTDSAEKVGLYFGLSSFIIGATIVAIGGSLPELATSVIGVLNGEKTFPIDNIVGSNIANAVLVGGVSAVVVGTLKVRSRLVDVDLPLFFISTALFIAFIWDGVYTWKEGIISIIFLILFVIYSVKSEAENEENDGDDEMVALKKLKGIWFLLILLGIIGIYGGAKYTIMSVQNLSGLLGIESSVITIIAVALGTSLPELTISVKAAMQGKHGIALGNIFGSNTFNAMAVASIPSFIMPLSVSDSVREYGILFLIIASLGFLFTTSDDTIQKWEGMALLIIYVAFIGKVIGVV